MRGGNWGATTLLGLVLVCGAALAALPAEAQQDREQGVYLRLVEGALGSVDQVSTRFRSTLGEYEGDWQVVTTYDAGVPQACEYDARIMVLHSPTYAATLMENGSDAAFAVPVRVAVYADEGGTHIGATNPLNLNRTIVIEEGHQDAWARAADDLRAMATLSFPDNAVVEQYGQRRDKGRIGRTMGVMAGGPFADKVKVAVSLPADGNPVADVVERLTSGLADAAGDWSWGIRPVYSIALGDDAAVIGVTGDKMEADAFSIVGAGNDDSRKDLACPGVDHAAAFPVEVLVEEVGDRIDIKLVGAMYRMKMFFEDAGRWKFAKNMSMPGSIEDEIKDKIRGVLDVSG